MAAQDKTLNWTNLPNANAAQVGSLKVTDLLTGPAVPVVRTIGDPNGTLTGADGQLALDYASGTLWQNTDGATAWVVFVSGGGGGNVGPGTINRIAKFTAATTVDDSQLSDDGTDVTGAVIGKLQIDAAFNGPDAVRIRTTAANGGMLLESAESVMVEANGVGGSQLQLRAPGAGSHATMTCGGNANVIGGAGAGLESNGDFPSGTGVYAYGAGSSIEIDSDSGTVFITGRKATIEAVGVDIDAPSGYVEISSDLGVRIAHGGAGDKLGAFGVVPVAQQADTAAASDLATVITLANAIRTLLKAYGLMA